MVMLRMMSFRKDDDLYQSRLVVVVRVDGNCDGEVGGGGGQGWWSRMVVVMVMVVMGRCCLLW